LLRFILDSHPELACPPETGFGGVCGSLARSWDVLDNAGSEGRLVTDQPTFPPYALAAIREAVDSLFGRYLQRRGKERWCDKSLDTYMYAELIAQAYPEARFVCMYRHVMDVVASGVETGPWGVSRFGFDPYVARYPGNNVAAIGSYWQETVQAVMSFEEKHAESCHRVRYEDLVAAPEQTVAKLFSFIGAGQVPGITEACFAAAHEGNGPGDEKIWFTSKITADSAGRGVRVPASALPPQLLQAVNELLAKLDYRAVDDDWNAASGPIDPRADLAQTANGEGRTLVPAANGHRTDSDGELDATMGAIDDRMKSWPGDELQELGVRWPALAGQTIEIVVQGAGGGQRGLRWTFEGQAAEVRGSETGTEPTATMIASAATWQALLAGRANLVGEMMGGRLRCVNKRDAYRLRSDEVHAIAELLGLTRFRLARIGDDTRPSDHLQQGHNLEKEIQ
jgi:hypothetical protein